MAKRVGTYLGGGTLLSARDKSYFSSDEPKPKVKKKKKFRLGFDAKAHLKKVEARRQKPKGES